MSVYTDLHTLAIEMLTEFGRDVVVTRDATRVGKLKAFQLSSKQADIQGSKLPNVAYTSNDNREFIVAPGKTLAVGDTLTVGTTEFVLTGVDECNPAGTSIYWKVTCS